MKMSNHDRRLTTELNFELYFVTEVLKLRSLHYGYWDEERPAEQFDLILFSESHRYFDRRVGLRRAHGLVRRGGHLLVSGMFRRTDKAPFPIDFEISDLPYVRMAAEYGFAPIEISDITSNVIPTVELVDRAIVDILEPTLRFAEAYVMARSPWKARLIRLLLSKEDKEFTRALKKLRRKTNPDRFREQFRYATLLFEAQ